VTRGHQAYFPAEQPEAQAAPRFPRAHGDEERPEDSGVPSRQGPQASQRVTAVSGGPGSPVIHMNTPVVEVERLRVRREFLFVAEGYSERKRLLVVQGRRRAQPRAAAGEGFTTTKKIGGSVVRNRARRRLREAARQLLPQLGVAGVDYVFIARQETATAAWPRLLDDMETALISLRRRLLPAAGGPAMPSTDRT
jgi:ribonuclease P protein component